jgi:hypothetical protein
MTRIVRSKPWPAVAVSVIALLLAMGGTCCAALSLPKYSVGSRQLKRGAVTPSNAANSTIQLFKGRAGDTGARGAKGDTGAQGLNGDPGAQGPKGDPGAAGTNSATHALVRTGTADVAYNSTEAAEAACNAGEVAVGGGGSFATANASAVEGLQRTGPLSHGVIAPAGSTADGWFARGYNTSSTSNLLTAFAICVSP